MKNPHLVAIANMILQEVSMLEGKREREMGQEKTIRDKTRKPKPYTYRACFRKRETREKREKKKEAIYNHKGCVAGNKELEITKGGIV
ncbi:hypothetical protein PABG_12015 [Paracoccidioides brasiliensis Pb03]|uniref:Uncharacterized protein n=2 Tax=Paracoccidioides brasiliensis TaxID=121759 RepID=A0A0A0HRV9_PARBD|nr:uncharacterized protein PADG_11924 [Paracoccidioides brasiliensis Pb18]KGM91949.1 hypothetical protein PADG_11924 [Paracoccidioides brasiliensis Pb18]KGY15070.1 hypothetical protein PABG_12015 [Paracoccidioides brasiliensis Pb03]ODH13736.1 hypothetical protein ACO22_06950 [Paracoccidioides brasiliensis]ODH49791.1 hypothetical protein GX48_04019 [Paracoccidioides brasiliensis]